MAMKLFMIYGEDNPHRDDAPYKAYLVVAADEATARAYAPSKFNISHVQVAKVYPDLNEPPARLAWVGGAYPLAGMLENPGV